MWPLGCALILFFNLTKFFGSFSLSQNTFEVILITDGKRTFAIYVYECLQLEWSVSQNGDHSTIGYNINPISAFGSGLLTFFEHPFSNQPIAGQIACSNLNKGSSYYSELFLVGYSTDPSQEARVECIEAVNYDVIYTYFISNTDITQTCPCTLGQAARDFAFRSIDMYDLTRDEVYRDQRCYSRRFTPTTDTVLCCYK